jgi:hypothetical protein
MVIETVRFRLHEGISRDDFQRAVDESTTYLETCNGFINRITGFNEDGECFDLVLWETAEDGLRVWEIFDAAPENRAFIATISDTTINMKHFDLVHLARNSRN